MLARRAPIGVFTYELGGYYFGGLLTGIHEVTRQAGIPLIIIQQSRRHRQTPRFSSDTISGWVVIHPTEVDLAHLSTLSAGKAPVVITPVPVDGQNCTLVQVDNRGGMHAAVLHLIDHGHERIVYVDHGPYLWSQERYRGYVDALTERGLAIDPTLVIRMESSKSDGVDVHQQRGEHAIRSLLEQGLSCTALVAATDTCAIAAMQAFQSAGRRIPEDLAVIGFDDVSDAQYADPPLTTIRTQFEVIGRAAAEQVLAEIRGGRPAQAQVISVPTTLVHRRSCGCTSLDSRLAGVADEIQNTKDWQKALTQQLAQVVRYPLPVDPAMPLAQVWPGAAVLVAAIDAVLQGKQPSYASIETAWKQAFTQTDNLETLNTALTLLEDAAEQLLATTPDVSRRPAMVALLRRMRLELIRARVAHEVVPKQQLINLVQSNNAVSMALLGSSLDDAQALGWLKHTPVTWGCLALWNGEPATDAEMLKIAGVYHQDATPSATMGRQVPVAAFPSLDQLPEGAQQGQELIIMSPVRSQTREWGVLVLCGWANTSLTAGMENLTILQATLLGATLDRSGALTALTEQQTTLQDAYNRERMLSQTIRELGCPIIPLLHDVLLVPLIGAIDSQRSQQIIGTILAAIGEHRAHTVLLDITGVPVVDTQVASSLIHTAQAATLLGTRVVMVGIRPEIAQSIVGLGIDLHQLTVYSTLASALSMLQLRSLSR